MNWDDIKFFLAITEAPSMRLAAKQLKVSHTTVSRRIEGLESRLGVKLFDRLSSGHVMTQSGKELLHIALQMDEKINDFNRKVIGRDTLLEGQIIITIPDAPTGKLFMPYFLQFMQENPAVKITVHDSYEVFNLTNLEADIALRFTNEPPEHLIGRCIGKSHRAAYATKEYVKAHKPHLKTSTAKWIGYGAIKGAPPWLKNSPFPHLSSVGMFDNMLLQYDIALASGGMGYFSCHLGDSDPHLIRLSDPRPSRDLWLLSHRDLRASARMRAFRHFIAEHIDEIKAKLEGETQKTISSKSI